MDTRAKDADTKFVVEVAARVVFARKSAGWSQAGLAHELRIEPATLSRYEVGARPFPVALLGRVADVLGIPLASLLPEGDESALGPSLDDLVAAWNGLDGSRRALLIRLARELSRR